VRIGVAATPWVAVPTLEWLSSTEHELVLIITQPDRPAGRGRDLRESSVGAWGRAHQLKVLKPESPESLVAELSGVDLVISIGYGVILPLSVISIPEFGFINLHFSLLPSWRGAAPVQRAILNGDSTSGVTVFQLDAGMDTGPIFISAPVQIESNDSSADVLEKMAALGPTVIEKTLDLISRQISPVPQRSDGVSYAPKIRKEEGKIAWESSALIIDRQVRALTPAPGAWTIWRGEKLKISKIHIRPSGIILKEGEISTVDGSVLVGCGTQEVVSIEGLTPAGKKLMCATEWINGARLSVGESFG
jgi:methionyl-tRNA formyltransferase